MPPARNQSADGPRLAEALGRPRAASGAGRSSSLQKALSDRRLRRPVFNTYRSTRRPTLRSCVRPHAESAVLVAPQPQPQPDTLVAPVAPVTRVTPAAPVAPAWRWPSIREQAGRPHSGTGVLRARHHCWHHCGHLCWHPSTPQTCTAPAPQWHSGGGPASVPNVAQFAPTNSRLPTPRIDRTDAQQQHAAPRR